MRNFAVVRLLEKDRPVTEVLKLYSTYANSWKGIDHLLCLAKLENAKFPEILQVCLDPAEKQVAFVRDLVLSEAFPLWSDARADQNSRDYNARFDVSSRSSSRSCSSSPTLGPKSAGRNADDQKSNSR